MASLKATFVDMTDFENVEKSIRDPIQSGLGGESFQSAFENHRY